MFELKKTEELCIMRLKDDAIFKENSVWFGKEFG